MRDRVPGARPPLTPAGRALRVVPSFVAAGVLLALVLPKVGGASWTDVVALLTQLTAAQVLLLAGLWFLGLYAHSYVLTAAMPRLTHRRALTLNLTGSAVSNLVPLGGALGIGLNYAMARSWGFSRASFTLYTLVSNLWDVLAKLSLPVVAVVLLLSRDQALDSRLTTAALAAGVALACVATAVAAALSSETAARRLGAGAGHVAGRALRAVGSERTVHAESAVLAMRHRTIGLLRQAWARLSLGMLAYAALQAVLLWATLHMLGSTLTATQVFAGYALERLLSLVLVTPGGTGLAEVGTTALLVALGGSPATTTAGVLLYRAFVFLLEIPVGSAGLLFWVLRRRVPADADGRRAPVPKPPREDAV